MDLDGEQRNDDTLVVQRNKHNRRRSGQRCDEFWAQNPLICVVLHQRDVEGESGRTGDLPQQVGEVDCITEQQPDSNRKDGGELTWICQSFVP